MYWLCVLNFRFQNVIWCVTFSQQFFYKLGKLSPSYAPQSWHEPYKLWTVPEFPGVCFCIMHPADIQLIDVCSFWLDDDCCSLNLFEKRVILMTANRFVQRAWKFLLFWIFNFADFLKYGLYGRVSIPSKCVRFLTSWKAWTPPTFYYIQCVPTDLVPWVWTCTNFIQLHFLFQAYWRGAKLRDFTLSNLKKVRMEKEWINWDLNLNLTTENMDERVQPFERILGAPHSALGNVCWYMHYKIYSH